MYPKLFFENFWDSDQKNNLFVCMPFHDSFDKKFEEVIRPAARTAKLEDAKRVKEDWVASEITSKILDGIANSRILLFDLSDDPKLPCEYSKQANNNVIYELGIATAIREPEDILLIKEESSTRPPFDIACLNINEYKKEYFTIEWLCEKIIYAVQQQEWFRSKRVKTAAQLIDPISLELMIVYSRKPRGEDHFHIDENDILTKTAVYRLMDIGVLYALSSLKEGGGFEFAYHWTQFGYEIMKYLGIK